MDAAAARDAAIDQVAAANALWIEEAVETVFAVAVALDYFTTDDVWAALDESDLKVAEPRALGAVMVRAAREGYCAKTGLYRVSKRRTCHARPLAVWQSLLVQ